MSITYQVSPDYMMNTVLHIDSATCTLSWIQISAKKVNFPRIRMIFKLLEDEKLYPPRVVIIKKSYQRYGRHDSQITNRYLGIMLKDINTHNAKCQYIGTQAVHA